MMKYVISVFVAVIAVISVAYAYTKSGAAKNIICEEEYALCSSAQCIPDPTHPDLAICFCEVHQGKSLGEIPCDKRTAHTDKRGIKHLISTFSFDDFGTKKTMTCTSGNPWTNCLDQPCTVDPLDPSKAICMCKIMLTEAFQTFGGDCDQSTCETGFWSGATIESNTQSIQFLMKALGLSKSPQKLCPQ